MPKFRPLTEEADRPQDNEVAGAPVAVPTTYGKGPYLQVKKNDVWIRRKFTTDTINYDNELCVVYDMDDEHVLYESLKTGAVYSRFWSNFQTRCVREWV